MPIRPDLSKVDPEVRLYIESLEAELADYHKRRLQGKVEEESPAPPLVPSEEPTTLNVITLTAGGIAKRTPRHLYQRQRRGGMGIFDLDSPDNDPPAFLNVADESQSLLLFTDLGRAFRLPVSQIVETPVHGRGKSILGKFVLPDEEHLAAILPDIAKGAVALLTERGMVRYLRHHVFGEYMKPGTAVIDPGKFGRLVAACRTSGDGDLLLATRQGRAIRFNEKLVPPQGGPGIRLEAGDAAVAITAVNDENGVFLIDASGKGTIRLMAGFASNKAPGSGGKMAMKTDNLVDVLTVQAGDDIFLISRLCKIIRFMADEIPAKEGVVQGVNCMAFRMDEVCAAVVSR